jgi:CRISPR/Cas system-associated exonuclease Cas4 (RecB family)
MITDLIDKIIEKRTAFLREKIKRWPASNFRASDITDCDRYMVHSVLDWDKKTLYDEGLQAIFDRGNKEELEVKRDLLDIGFEVIEAQTPFEIKSKAGDVMCRGHVDGKIAFKGKIYPIEIKSMNMNTFNRLNSLEDFQRTAIHRKYLRQMQLYLFGNNAEEGMFILADLQGHMKIIPVYLDLGECEWLLQRIERNWAHIKAKTYPDRIDYQEKICGKCSFSHLCLPDVNNAGVEMIDNKEVEEKLERRNELAPLVEEYEAIDEEVKQPFKLAEKGVEVMVGTRWRIVSKKATAKRLDTKAIPEEIRKEYEVESVQTRVSIIDMDNVKEKKKA